MKVLMFGWEFPPNISGGLGTACYGLSKGLAKQNVDVLFVLPKVFGNEEYTGVRFANASDISISFNSEHEKDFFKRIAFMEIDSPLSPYMNPEEYYNRMAKEFKDTFKQKAYLFSEKFSFSGHYGTNLKDEIMRYALVAAKIASTATYDVIHAHDWLTYPAGISAKKVSGKPLIVHVHATEFDRSGEHVNQPVYDIERQGMTEADLVITVSNLTRQIVIERYGIPAEKVITVHNAVEPVERPDREEVTKHVKEKVVTFLGRVTYQKGPDYFVEAAYKVLKRDSNVRFVMAGSGDLLNRMIRRVAQLKIATKFHFTGFLAGPEVDTMFAMSDVYVMPSVSEPFGISPLEAMRSNVPVVISKQSGVAEVLQHALKVDFWDIDALADAIYGILHYEGLSKMFIRYGKSEVDNLIWENAAINVIEVYNQAVL